MHRQTDRQTDRQTHTHTHTQTHTHTHRNVAAASWVLPERCVHKTDSSSKPWTIQNQTNHLAAASWPPPTQKDVCMRMTYKSKGSFTFVSQSRTHILLHNWQQLRRLVLYFSWLWRGGFPRGICILSCFVWLRGVLFGFLSVFEFFLQNAGSQLCFRFFKKKEA